ncbi:MAG: EamA family transporter [Minisyncoccia bacterium]
MRWLLRDKSFTPKQQISFTFQCIAVLFAGSLLFPFFSPFFLNPNYSKLFFLALVCGLFGAAFNVLQYVAQKYLEAGVGGLVRNIYTPITILLSSFLLHEGLTPIQIVGTLLLLMSIFIVSKKHRTGKFTFDKYFVLMLLSGVLLSAVLVAERELQRVTGFSAGVMLSWGAQAASLGLLALFIGEKHTYSKKQVLITGGLQFLKAFSYVMLVWVVGNLSLVTSITTFQVILLFIAGAVFLKEREDLGIKIFGSIIAVIGLLLMK